MPWIAFAWCTTHRLELTIQDGLKDKFFNKVDNTILQIFYLYQKSPKSSHQRCSIKKGVLKNFPKFTGKHLCQSLFFNKVAGLKRLWHRHCPVNFVKFLKTPFLQNMSG